MELEFWKMNGAGNDFIVINNMGGLIPEEGRTETFARWCRRGLGIGADGVLLVEPSVEANFRMRYYNADGREAETCGNGSRCIARFAYEQQVAPAEMRFETLAGIYEAEVRGDTVAVRMTDAHSMRMMIPLAGELFKGTVHFIDTGVPHVVIFVDDLENASVVPIGRWVRNHELFSPKGTNVNFVRVVDHQTLSIRTYERGVEDETLACGTGSVASAVIATRLNFVKPPVAMRTRSGEVLTIEFELTTDGARRVVLDGPARFVFRGFIEASFPNSQ